MPYFILCVLVLLVASLSMRLRIRNMRRARCELERRRLLRSQLAASTMHGVIVSDTVSLRLLCDASPAIESIAKAQAAFDLYDEMRAAWLKRASRLETSERSLGAIEKEHRQRVKR